MPMGALGNPYGDDDISDADFEKLRAKAAQKIDAYNKRMKGKDVATVYGEKDGKQYNIDRSTGKLTTPKK